jgi:hypothetical protein
MNEHVSYASLTLLLGLLLGNVAVLKGAIIVGGNGFEHLLLAEHGVVCVLHVVILVKGA